MINIVLTDDHVIVREAIRAILDNEPDMQVVFQAENDSQVLKWLDDGNSADLILSDMNISDRSGTRVLENLSADAKVLIFTILDHGNHVADAISGGASGYLLKSVSKSELMFAIRFVSEGGSYICSEICFKFLSLVNDSSQHNKPAQINHKDFSEREVEILGLMGDGYTNIEIAQKLFTSVRTVEGYRQNLIAKTGVKNTSALIKFAMINGLIR